ncbi:hypothetical protein [Rhodococcus pyridinivorans]|nr:hypothetical protein [Rhodococcus pyridinivorans]
MSKKIPTKPEQELVQYFVPGIGQIEARDLADLEDKVKQLEEQEVGDGDI